MEPVTESPPAASPGSDEVLTDVGVGQCGSDGKDHDEPDAVQQSVAALALTVRLMQCICVCVCVCVRSFGTVACVSMEFLFGLLSLWAAEPAISRRSRPTGARPAADESE